MEITMESQRKHKMKVILLFSGVLLFSASAVAQQHPKEGLSTNSYHTIAVQPQDGPAEFLRLAEEWKNAYNSGDASRLGSMYAEDAEYVSPHVEGLIIRGRDIVQANFRRGMQSDGHIDSVRIVSSRVSGDMAYLVCRYDATNSGQRVNGRNVLIAQKTNGRWLIVVHASVVRD